MVMAALRSAHKPSAQKIMQWPDETAHVSFAMSHDPETAILRWQVGEKACVPPTKLYAPKALWLCIINIERLMQSHTQRQGCNYFSKPQIVC